MAKIPSYLLNLAGEYRVCSELNKRGIFATVTYGNHKGVDVYAISDHRARALKIEVKTSQQRNFVTNITRKGLCKQDNPHAPDFWVLFQIQPQEDGTFEEHFFVLTHKQMCRAQSKRNDDYERGYIAKYGRSPDPMKGVDNVTVKDVQRYRVGPNRDQWNKIKRRLRGSAAAVDEAPA